MSEADVVELVGYVECYWQPDISRGDALANAVSECLLHHSWICLLVKSIQGRVELSMVADHIGTISLGLHTSYCPPQSTPDHCCH